MKKSYRKEVLALLVLTLSLSGVVGCQDGKKPVSLVSDAPPGASTDDNRIVASMGAVNLVNKQVLGYLQSLNPRRVSAALNKDGGLEDLVKGVALRANVVARATREGWHEQAAVKTRVEEAQRNVLYNMYINERSLPQADYPDDGAVARVYEARQQQQVAAGSAALEPLDKMAPAIRQRLRQKRKQVNEKNYFKALVARNPITVDMDKLVEFTSLSQQQKQQQGAERLQESVVRMGDLNISLEQVLMSLGSKAPAQQRQLLNNTRQLQQYLHRLAIQHSVVNEATAAQYTTRPKVKNDLEQARLQVVYATYMKHWTAPESSFPGAALVEESYQKNLERLVIPERYQLARIVILNGEDAASYEIQVKQIAEAARASGADFAALARQYSQEPRSAVNGGNIGWFNTQALSPELRQVIGGNQPGSVVGPLQYKRDWRIVKILDHQPARQQTLDEARPALVAVLRKQRRAENERQIIEQLVASEPVTIDSNALQQLRQQIKG